MKRTRDQLIRVTALQTMLAEDDYYRFSGFGGSHARRSTIVLRRYRRLLWDLVTENGTKTREDIDARVR